MQFALQTVTYNFCDDGVVYPGLVYENKVSNSVGWNCDFSNKFSPPFQNIMDAGC